MISFLTPRTFALLNQAYIRMVCVLLLGSVTATQAQVLLGGDSLQINYAEPKEYTIGGITLSGVTHLDQNLILMSSGLSVGDKIQVPGDRFSTAIETLWKQGMFEDIQIEATKIQGATIFLNIALVERPRLSKYSFKGVSKSEADDIREKISISRGKVVTDYILASIQNTTRDFYLAKGYLNTQVKLETKKDSANANAIDLIIRVNKGERVKIQEIYLEGNNSIADNKLMRAMKDTKRNRIWNIFNSSKFLESNLEQDKEKILQKYLAKGYRDARIVKDTVYFIQAKQGLFKRSIKGIKNALSGKRRDPKVKIADNRVAIQITIDEGKKYYFRNISWLGNTKYTAKQLSTILGIKKGDVYNQSTLETKLFMNPNGNDVSSLYMDDGYLFFQVVPVEVQVVGDSIDLEMRIYEGKQATINRVTIKGNTKTNDHVILREIRTRPGQLFRRSDIIRTQRELSQLGYFDPEKMGVTPTPNAAEGTVDIEYTVEEKPSDQIELSGGWGGGRIVGTLGVSFNNFSARNFFKANAWRPLPSGDGQRLSVRAQSNGIFYQSVSLSFTEPWLGGKKPNSLSVTSYWSRQALTNAPRKIEVDGERVINPLLQSIDVYSVSAGFGKRLRVPDDYFSVYHELSYNYYVLYNYNILAGFNTGFSNNINYRFMVSRNSVDKPIFETRGSNITFSGEWTPPYSRFNNKNYADITAQEKYRFVEYQKYKFTAQWFNSLTNKRGTDGKEARNLVLNTRIGYGFLGNYSKRIGTTPFERFFLGGSGLSGFNPIDGREIIALRGYDDQRVSPDGGGAFIGKYTLELRYPISLNPSATIFALTFAEAGNSWNKISEFNPFQVKRSAGVGIRVFLPMFGLLGFDYGWRFDDIPNYPNMEKSQFHFTIGGYIGEL